MHRNWWLPVSAIGAALLTLPVLPAAGAPAQAGPPTYQMEVLGVAPDPQSGAPVLFLRAKEDKRQLSMFIGPFEAQGIVLALEGSRTERPYTHELMLEAIHRLQAKVKRVVITGVKEDAFLADLVLLNAEGREVVLDARPSDAIALALREGAPILAAEPVFAHSQSPRESQPRRGSRL